jgi:DNA polymerase III epsilon subunit-like protein
VTSAGLPVAVLDTETTGLDPSVDAIVEVAIVSTDATGLVAEVFASLVDPGRPVEATHIHGISDPGAAEAPSLTHLWPAITSRLAGRVVVGHNVAFDWDFLAAGAARAGLVLPEVVLVDTKGLAKRQLDLPQHRLVHCCAELGIALGAAHSAAADAVATTALFAALDHDEALRKVMHSAAPTTPMDVMVKQRRTAPPPEQQAG